jgi:hypothetical protein
MWMPTWISMCGVVSVQLAGRVDAGSAAAPRGEVVPVRRAGPRAGERESPSSVQVVDRKR